MTRFKGFALAAAIALFASSVAAAPMITHGPLSGVTPPDGLYIPGGPKAGTPIPPSR